jgi:hypothetical protein
MKKYGTNSNLTTLATHNPVINPKAKPNRKFYWGSQMWLGQTVANGQPITVNIDLNFSLLRSTILVESFKNYGLICQSLDKL